MIGSVAVINTDDKVSVFLRRLRLLLDDKWYLLFTCGGNDILIYLTNGCISLDVLDLGLVKYEGLFVILAICIAYLL